MATIIPHTTRSAGTILTAAIYNSDHQVHITNANALNAGLTGLGTASAKNTGTSGNTIPLLDGINTWSGDQTIANTTPALTLTDTDIGASTVIDGSSTTGSFFVRVDNGDAAAGSVFRVTIDGSANQRFQVDADGQATVTGSSQARLILNDEAGVIGGNIDTAVQFQCNGSNAGYIGHEGTASGNMFIDNVDGDGGIYLKVGPSTSIVHQFDGTTVLATNSSGLTITGTIVASSNITGYSDLSLKTDFSQLPLEDAIQIVLDGAKAAGRWTEQKTNRRQMGLIANAFDESAPELVFKDKEGIRSLDYGHSVAPLFPVLAEVMKRLGMTK